MLSEGNQVVPTLEVEGGQEPGLAYAVEELLGCQGPVVNLRVRLFTAR